MNVRGDISDLIDRARRGNPEAIGRLFEAARGHLLQLADRESPSEMRAKIGPSDLVQETAVDMHRDFGNFHGTTAEECFAWLREVLRHNIVDAVRSYRATLKRDTARAVGQAGDPIGADAGVRENKGFPDGSAMRREEAATVNEIIERLPSDYRLVLQLRYWSGMSFVDMAPRLGRSPDAARKLWYRALERLHVELAGVAGRADGTPVDRE